MADYSISKSTPIGKRFGMLVVTGHPFKPQGKSRPYVACQCDCGISTVKASADLSSGGTRSCGCFAKASSSSREATHGMSNSPEYYVWKGIKQRCTNPNHTHYKSYGGRGISMCERWLNSFENFLADMGKRPEGMTIDRKENDLGYFKENCRWAPPKDQSRNTRSNNYVEYQGRRISVMELSEAVSIEYQTLLYRINHGWSVEKAVITPSQNIKNRKPRK